MKKLITAGIAAMVMGAPISHADGLHIPGTVNVTPNVSLSGAMNVRYNTTVAGNPYLYANGYAGSAVNFAGLDSDGDSFICTVSPGNPLYAEAVAIKNNLSSTGFLLVRKPENSNECNQVYLLNGSYWQD
ncbi:hypothetical protein [Marinibactrum halimedae]|uniref:Uncharacterized protein n=1 Tax=Marinibactrum halimedae TaxID=1444977 RepID=A0AA37WMQ9_9GAMM|nr:hypothetical protein [Marinibactrum halimedae]MCD9460676.1 hypothetical protein [Marinibactrum halimedae]GLS24322.1 hypothetical protein GCM10007877_00330 [Marinibactrum halimedae]